MEPIDYFLSVDAVNKKRYDALREFFLEGKAAKDVAERYGYTLAAFYSLSKEFRNNIKEAKIADPFFKPVPWGRKPHLDQQFDEEIIALRKQNYSTEDIVSIVNALGF